MMRVLGHIHTLNDEEIIERSLQALLGQTRPLDGIVLVDNGSTDGTLRIPFPPDVHVIRHETNEGTSGAVITGMRYALDHEFDWVWLFDADSLPAPDALERLLELYESLSPPLRQKTWRLSSLPIEDPHGIPRHGIVFTDRGCSTVIPAAGEAYYECHGTIWSGSLYRASLVRALGTPNPDYVLDWGEYEYGYLGMKAGLKGFMHTQSLMRHSVGDVDPPARPFGFGPWSVSIPQMDYPPIRLYYIFRNCLYFWLHVYYRGNVFRYLRQSRRSPSIWFLLRWLLRIVLMSGNRTGELKVCMLGLWHGLRKNLGYRYGSATQAD